MISRLKELGWAKFKIQDMYVDARMEYFRTRVQFPPPPPNNILIHFIDSLMVFADFNFFWGLSGSVPCSSVTVNAFFSFQDKDFGCGIGRRWPKKAYPLPAAFPKSLS